MSCTVAMSDKFFIIFCISLKKFAGFYLNQKMGTVKGGDVKLSNSSLNLKEISEVSASKHLKTVASCHNRLAIWNGSHLRSQG